MPGGSDKKRAFQQWVNDLVCPACHGALRFDEADVTCTACGRIYPVVDGLPVLISERAEPQS